MADIIKDIDFIELNDTFCIDLDGDWIIKNKGPGLAQNVQVSLTLPSGISIQPSGSTVSKGTFDEMGLVWSVGSLLKNETATASFCFQVDDDCTAPWQIDFDLTSDACDCQLNNNSVCAQVKGLACCDVSDCLDNIYRSIRTITADDTALSTDHTVLIDAVDNTVTLTLPTPASAYNPTKDYGLMYLVKVIDNTYQATITTPSGKIVNDTTIDGLKSTGTLTLTGQPLDVAATGTLTFTGQPADTETVTIGSKAYQFQTVLTNVDGNVLIGATASDSLDNLIAAINLGAGSGTTYAAATTANTDVSAAAGAGDTMDVTALVSGSGGNSIASTETVTNGSWGGATLSGGVTETVTIGSKTYTFQETLINADGNVHIGATADDTLDNLRDAIILGPGAGVDYAAAMTVHPTVTAADGTGTSLDMTAITAGVAGDLIATTETLTNGSFGNATLQGGADAATASYLFGSLGEAVWIQSDGTNWFVV